MKNFGMMLTKDEAPILRNVLDQNTQYIKHIYVIDGGSDNAESILRDYPQITFYVHERELKEKYGLTEIVDGIRHYLYEEILKTAAIGDWVTVMHGDEVFYHNPNEVAALASLCNLNMIKWWCPFFFPHKDDLPDWEARSHKPLTERFTHYGHNGSSAYWECRQFRIEEGMFYDVNHHSRVVPEGRDLRVPSFYPLLKHYKIWNVDLDTYEVIDNDDFFRGQSVLKMKGKWGKVPIAAKNWHELFLENLPGFSHCSNFEGNFGVLEQSYDTFRATMVQHLAEKGTTIAELLKMREVD